jgi:hypothetical protein
MTSSISRFIPDLITTGGPFVLNVTSHLQTLHHLPVCPPDVTHSHQQIQITVEYPDIFTLPAPVLVVIQKEAGETRQCDI